LKDSAELLRVSRRIEQAIVLEQHHDVALAERVVEIAQEEFDDERKTIFVRRREQAREVRVLPCGRPGDRPERERGVVAT
jgi:hypothetical protein